MATGQRSVALVSSSASKALRGYTSLPYRVISRHVSESNTALPKDLPPKSTAHDYLELWVGVVALEAGEPASGAASAVAGLRWP